MNVSVQNKKVFFSNYLLIYIVSTFLLIEVLFLKIDFLVAPSLIFIGFLTCISVYLKCKIILTPITVFSVIWLILVPICSYAYPLMEKMTVFEWSKVLTFIVAFCFGALCSLLIKRKKIKERPALTKKSINFNYFIIFISLISLIIMFFQFGSIPLFYEDANIAKFNFRQSSVFNMLSYFGYPAILTLVIDDIKHIFKNKFVLLLIVFYLFLLVLSAERFFITLLLLSCLYVFSKHTVNKKLMKKMLLVIVGVLGIFTFVLNYRGNSDQKQLYFIDSGIYKGSASELTKTEIFRYLGMQQRVLTNTFDYVEPFHTKGTLTLSPILKVVGVEPITIPDVQIYGYTSKSIITKTYCDFGYLWWCFVVIVSFVINRSFDAFDKKNSLLSQYFCITWLVFLTFSFYAYFDNLILLYLHFPIYIKFLEIYNTSKIKG